jgi:septal ring factor EnvC (AmiA/AmiB activator)
MIPINLISSFKILSELFSSLQGQLDKAKGTPKQKLARNIIELFDVLDEFEKSVAVVIKNLNEFEAEKQIGMRVHIIHKTQFLFDELENSCNKFLHWVQKHKEFSITLNVFAPAAYEKYGLSTSYSRVVTEPKSMLSETLKTFRSQLQAVRSPDPKLFPKKQDLENIMAQFQILLTNIKKFRKDIRKFASTKLSVDDFFK